MRLVVFFILGFASSRVSSQSLWQEVGSFSAGPVHVIVGDNYGRVFAGTDVGGVYFSSSNGIGWNQVNNGLTVPYVRSLALDSMGSVFVGTQGGGVFRSTNGGSSWTATSAPTQWTIRALAANASGVILAGTSGGGVFRSSNAGLSWMQLNNGIADPFVRSFSFCSPDTLFAGTGFAGVYRSTDAGSTWTISFSNDGDFRSLAAPRARSAYAGSAGSGVFRTTNAGSSWSAINNGLTNLVVEALSVTANGDVWTATRGGVFCSTNGGVTWLPRNSGLNELDVRSLAVLPEGFLLAGTASGKIFRSARLTTYTGTNSAGPNSATLEQNYPNPFNSSTTIRFTLLNAVPIRLSLHDVLGREVALLQEGRLATGADEVAFARTTLASGIYFYTLRFGDSKLTKQMTILK
jgi:photosystem II stability/assembly factor-like uncharacterized protein